MFRQPKRVRSAYGADVEAFDVAKTLAQNRFGAESGEQRACPADQKDHASGVRDAREVVMYTEKEQTTSTEAICAAAASLTGATIGIIAGPAGVVAGAVIGSLVGAAAGAMVADSNHRRWVHDEEVDYDIGVYDGTIGAAPPDAPPVRIGAFSSGSAGAAGARPSTPPPNAGPMQEIEG